MTAIQPDNRPIFDSPESALVRLAQQGNKHAAGELLAHYRPIGLNLAQQLVGNPEVAGELVQEAMLAAFLSLDSLRQPESFSSWFYGIVLNVCRSYLRNRHADYLSLEALQGGMWYPERALAATSPNPHSVAEARELHDLVIAAINTLSPKNREATLLFYFQQLSLREIATLLGITVPAVKGRLHKSRLQLRDYLSGSPMAVEMGWTPTIHTSERQSNMIPVTIVDVIPDYEKGHSQVILFDEMHARVLSMWIGPVEGDSIAAGLIGYHVPRPLTYDFTAKLLKAAGARLQSVRISKIEDITFFAVAVLETGDTTQEIDARPSDALALALRFDCPIYVDQAVMQKAGQPVPAEREPEAWGKGLKQIAENFEERKLKHEQQMQEWREKFEERKLKDQQKIQELREEAERRETGEADET
jgi:RNA polymerase sigma factor (sigma-70 family)